MRPSKEQLDRLEQALARAHTIREVPEFSPGWVYAVMRDVRRDPGRMRTTEVPRLMWRAATVVAFLSMVVIGSVLVWDAEQADAGFAGFFTESTLDLSLL